MVYWLKYASEPFQRWAIAQLAQLNAHEQLD